MFGRGWCKAHAVRGGTEFKSPTAAELIRCATTSPAHKRGAPDSKEV